MKRGPSPKPLAERFWPKVEVSGPDECWLWTASIGSHGYGQISIPGQGPVTAQRAAWLLTNGPIPDDMCVLHRCDVRRCCNPKHLFLGTDADNVADMHAKGRAVVPPPRFGADHPRSKLRKHARGGAVRHA